MQWGDVTHLDHGRRVVVSAISTPKFPYLGERYTGVIECPRRHALPHLRTSQDVIRAFMSWWDVEFIDRPDLGPFEIVPGKQTCCVCGAKIDTSQPYWVRGLSSKGDDGIWRQNPDESTLWCGKHGVGQEKDNG